MPSYPKGQTTQKREEGVSPDTIDDDQAVLVCSEWLGRYAEYEELTRRWQALETRLFQEHNWCQLSDEEQSLLPEGAELEAIQVQIEDLFEKTRGQLVRLIDIPAPTVAGVACKLSVALAIVFPDENEEAHNLLRSILTDVEAIGREIDQG